MKSAIKRAVFIAAILAAFAMPVTGCGRATKPANGPSINPPEVPSASENAQAQSKPATTVSSTIALAVNEWVGWKPLLDANGGLSTAPESRLGKLKIQADISPVDMPEAINGLLEGKYNAIGCSVADLADMRDKLQQNGVSASMVCVVGRSSGWDAVLAKPGINNAEDFIRQNARLAAYPFSGAYELFRFEASNNKTFDTEAHKQLMESVTQYETQEEAYNAFLNGEAEAVCLSEPLLSEALKGGGAAKLFASDVDSTVAVYGIVFERSYIEANKQKVTQFVAAVLNETEEQAKMYEQKLPYFDLLRTFPSYHDLADEELEQYKSMVAFSDRADNYRLFNVRSTDMGRVRAMDSLLNELFYTFCERNMTENTINTVFDTEFLERAFYVATSEPSSETENPPPPVSKEIRIVKFEGPFVESGFVVATREQYERLLKNSPMNVFYFKGWTEEFAEDPAEEFKKLANLANMRSGSDLILVGRVANIDQEDNPDGRKLSETRAMEVATQLVNEYGIDAGRITVIGLGVNFSEPRFDVKDRRVDVIFKDQSISFP